MHSETEIKALGFLQLHEHDCNACDGMIFKMFDKHKVH